MLSNEMMENDALKHKLEQRYQKATDVWRLRKLQSKGSQALIAILTSLVAFFVR